MLAVPVILHAFSASSFGQTDVSGAWDMTVESDTGAGDALVTFRQDGQDLTGTYKGRMGESALTGSIRDTSIQFSVTLRFRDITFTVTYRGKVEGDGMQGTADFGEGKSGTWRARRHRSS